MGFAEALVEEGVLEVTPVWQEALEMFDAFCAKIEGLEERIAYLEAKVALADAWMASGLNDVRAVLTEVSALLPAVPRSAP